jgi:hypothetical protein
MRCHPQRVADSEASDEASLFFRPVAGGSIQLKIVFFLLVLRSTHQLNLKQLSRTPKEYTMTTRYLIAALLMSSACVAQADVLPASGTQSTFQGSWTTSTGANVLTSGSLVGGASYGVDGDAMIKAMFDKASANSGGDDSLAIVQGIDAAYVTRSTNARVAVLMGNGVSVVNDADGNQIVTQGSTANAEIGSGSGSTGGATGSVSGSTGGTTAGAPVATVGAGAGGGTANAEIGAGGQLINAPGVISPLADATAVPEPSSIALMMAGMMGALAIGRRRRK